MIVRVLVCLIALLTAASLVLSALTLGIISHNQRQQSNAMSQAQAAFDQALAAKLAEIEPEMQARLTAELTPHARQVIDQTFADIESRLAQ